MANVSQGVTVTWNGVTLGEVISVTVDGVSADNVDLTSRTSTSRYKVISRGDTDLGTVSVTSRGNAAMSSTNAGLTAALSIGGPGVSFSFPVAMFQSFGWAAAVGDMQTYSVTFKLGG